MGGSRHDTSRAPGMFLLTIFYSINNNVSSFRPNTISGQHRLTKAMTANIRPTQAYNSKRRSPRAYNSHRRPMTANEGHQGPTTANKGCQGPMTANTDLQQPMQAYDSQHRLLRAYNSQRSRQGPTTANAGLREARSVLSARSFGCLVLSLLVTLYLVYYFVLKYIIFID